MTSILVHSAGPGVSLQDAGRHGFLRFGVTHAGPMDPSSHALANIAVGNDRTATAIEVSLGGLEVSTTSAALDVAVVGLGFTVTRDGKRLDQPCRLTLKTGERLKIAAGETGSWCYVAVAAGFDLPKVLGSHATHTRSGFGGINGRCLMEGDRIGTIDARSFCLSEGKLVAPWLARANDAIRVLPGPQRDYFDEDQYDAFLNGPWEIGARSDRMGIFITGTRLRHSQGYDIVSDGVIMGSIQVPGDGLPIVLMADSQSTGGYPKIATVIGADLGGLAQSRPGDKITFSSVSHDDALRARELSEANLAAPIEVEPFLRTEFSLGFVSAIDWTDNSDGALALAGATDEELHKQGELTDRERLSVLFDDGSCSVTEFGVLTVAEGRVYGQNVLAITHSRGSAEISAADVDVLLTVREHACLNGAPLVSFYSDRVIDTWNPGQPSSAFAKLVGQRANTENLEIALVSGRSMGASAILASLADVVLTSGPAPGLSLASSELTRRITNEIVSSEELARAEDVSSAHFSDDVSAILGVRRLLSFFSKSDEAGFSDPLERSAPCLDHIRAGGPYDIIEIVKSVADYGEVFEFKTCATSGILTAIAKMGGTPSAIIANQPQVNGGLVSVADLEKSADFLRFCERRQLPLVRFVHVAGILHRDGGGGGRAIAAYVQLMRAAAHLKTPQIIVITGQASGLAGVAMGAVPMDGSRGFQWAETAGAKRHYQAGGVTAGYGSFELITPRETRAKIIDALRSLAKAGK